VAKPLAKFMAELPDYTQQTKRLTPEALAVRDAFRIAKSPQKLLFELIPEACRKGTTMRDGQKQDAFGGVLIDVLTELKHAVDKLRNEFQDRFRDAFHLAKNASSPGSQDLQGLKDLREITRGRFAGLDQYTIDSDGLKAFLQRATAAEGDDEKWFSNLLYFLGRKPLHKWTDVDRDSAELRLVEFSRRINDLEKLRVHYDQFGKGDSDHEAYLIKTSSRLTGEKDEVVFLTEDRTKAIETVTSSIKDKLSEIADTDLRLAALAKIADELLTEYRESHKSGSSKGNRNARKKA